MWFNRGSTCNMLIYIVVLYRARQPKSNSEDVTIVGAWGGLDGNSWKYEPKDPITQIDIGFEPGYRVNYIRFKITPGQQSQYYGSTNGNLTEGKVRRISINI